VFVIACNDVVASSITMSISIAYLLFWMAKTVYIIRLSNDVPRHISMKHIASR